MKVVVTTGHWSYKSCKAPVKSSPPTNKYPAFLQAGWMPFCQSTEIRTHTETSGLLAVLYLRFFDNVDQMSGMACILQRSLASVLPKVFIRRPVPSRWPITLWDNGLVIHCTKLQVSEYENFESGQYVMCNS